MSGRGQPSRGGRAHIPEYMLDNRRGRGRPRKFPLTSPVQLPSEDTVHQEDDEIFQNEDDEYFQPDEEEESNKIDKIQQQKMMIVTPMSQKRARGRPPRTMEEQPMDEEELMEDHMIPDIAHEETVTSGPLEGPSEAPQVGRNARPRAIPRRVNLSEYTQDKQPPLKMPKLTDDTIEPLVPNEAHIEEVRREVRPEVRVQPKMPNHPSIPKPAEPPNDGQGPPPAPKHLVNKANSRGRPANMIPPHRRPIPKDIVPPGPVKKTARETSAKRKEPEKSVEPEAQPAQDPKSRPVDLKMEAPEAVQEVVISESDGPAPPPLPPNLQQHIQQQNQQATSSGSIPTLTAAEKKKEREGGKDLPSEHFPRGRAQHVISKGLHANNKPEVQHQIQHQYDMQDHQIIMHHPDDEGAQERVLTLQGNAFIEDRIGRVELMEEEEMKMMKSMQQQQYIQVEEDGVNVMYEVDPRDVIEEEEQVQMEDGAPEEYVMERQMQMQTKVEIVDDEDDDLPPQLVAEGVPEESAEEIEERRHNLNRQMEDENAFDLNMMQEGEMIRLNSPGGRTHEVRLLRDAAGNVVFIDENEQIVELVTDTGAHVEPSSIIEAEQQGLVEEPQDKKHMIPQTNEGEGSSQQIHLADQGNLVPGRAIADFSFLDDKNICCGLCGEIVLYEKLVSEHLPNNHPEYLSPGVELEEVPYENWLKTRLKQESKSMENNFRHFDEHDTAGFGGAVRLYSKGLRQLRKVSQIRVNVNEMTMGQLENALKRKLTEKMSRRVPVSLVDRLHARCDICQAVVSLNKKFEVIHLVRHFNAWHPAEHRCSQEWKEVQTTTPQNSRRPLSLHDFAVVRTDIDQNNLQCIWCGMFMDRAALGMHFTEVHTTQVVVPNCSLCLQEMVMTARLMEKYGEDFGVSLPDEFHLHSSKLDAKYSSEKALDKAIDKYLKRAKTGNENEDEDGNDDAEAICTTNSQQSFGRRNRLKRKFVKPCFRQICPTNSQFFEAKSACEWKCKLCSRAVYGAVISAGAIKHYKEFHPSEIDNMQYELVKARLERIGDGSMEFVHPQLVECLICNLTYALHKPFNICRAIRHLRLKHPEVMPETAGKPISGAEIAETTDLQKPIGNAKIRFGDLITDPIALERFRKDNFDQQFDKVQVVYGIKKNNEPAYILLMENEKMDLKTAQEMAEKAEQDEEEGAEENVQFEEVQEQEFEQGTSAYRPEGKDNINFPEQIVEGEEQVMEMPPTQYMPQYDATNPDHVLIEENEIMNDANYEMIQEGDYQDMADERDVRYLTEDEIREAQARGELLEFAEEYVEEYTEPQ